MLLYSNCITAENARNEKKNLSIDSSLLTALPNEGAGRESSRGDSIGMEVFVDEFYLKYLDYVSCPDHPKLNSL